MNFRSGVKHGFGVYTSASGFRYEGEWSDGEQTGSAKISYKNGDWYDGAVKNGVRCGLGELSELSSQRIFKGNWQNGSLVGDIHITSSDWKGAVKLMRTRIGLLAPPKSMRSIIDATQREQRHGSA